MFPRSGGEKVYLQAAYPRPQYLAITLYTVQAVLLSATGKSSHSSRNWNMMMIGIQLADVSFLPRMQYLPADIREVILASVWLVLWPFYL